MTQYPESGVKLVVDSTEYTSAMNEAIFLADYFDSYGELTLNISAYVDTASFDADLPEAGDTIEVTIEADVEGTEDLPLDGESVDFTVEADVEGIEDLPLDGETVDFTVEASIEGEVEDLPLDGETVHFTADGQVEGAVTDLPVDGETIETTLDVAETQTAKDTLSAVETIKNLKVLETVWNIAGTAVDLFKNFGGQVLNPMMDLDSAVARVNATTGNAIPNARTLIKDIFYDDLGESIDQVADLVMNAEQLKLPIDEATRAALTFTHTFQDENPEQVLKTLNQMVGSDLATNFQEAGDLITVAFQNGANRGGDLLDAINNNATAIQDLGITGPEALSFITTGLDAGFTSATDVLNTLIKIKQNVTNAAGNAKSDVNTTLNMLGIANPAETGEAWSADFFASVIKGIQNAPVSDAEKMAMFSNLVGGKIGAREFSSFMKMSPEDAAGIFSNVTGAAATAATEIDNSLSGAIDDFMLAANLAAQDFFSSEQIDLPGKIEALKTGLQDALNVLAEGGTLGDALTIALKPIGFDDEFQGLESALGNFVIGILQAVAAIQDATGHGKEAEGTRITIANMAKQQLEFDLKVGNPDDVSSTIATAVSRGVTPSEIAKTVGSAVTDLVKNGAPEAAQAIVDSLESAPAVELKLLPGIDDATKGLVQQQLEAFGFGTLNPDGTITMNITPGMTPEAVQGLANTIVDTVTGNFDAKVIEGVTIDPVLSKDAITEIQSQINDTRDKAKQDAQLAMQDARLAAADAGDEIKVKTDALKQTATDTAASVDTVNKRVNETAKAADTAAASLDVQTTSTQLAADTSTTAAPAIDLVTAGLDKVNASSLVLAPTLDAVAASIQKVLDAAASLSTASAAVAKKQGELDNSTGDTPPSKHHALGTRDAIGTSIVGDAGPEILTTNQHLAVLNNKTTEAIMAALQGYIPGVSFSSGGGNIYSLNQVNNVQSEAQADSLGYRTAEQLRGMAGA